MTATFGDNALRNLGDLKIRYPDVFFPPLLRRLKAFLFATVVMALFIVGIWRLEFSPGAIIHGVGELGQVVALMFPPDPVSWARVGLVLHALAETVAIAFLGTLCAALLAFPFSFLAARNTTMHRIVQFFTRRFFDSVRGIDTLIWALVWINVVGLGPFAGMLAIMSSDFGAFGKLFSETIEAADSKPAQGVISTGGNAAQKIRFGVLPEVLPVLIGHVLYYFESNTRSGTIIGIVGAGGIGLYLSEQIRTLEWPAVSFALILILIMVAVIDTISTRLRKAIMG